MPFDSRRNASGAFAELVAPVIKQLELGASVRYDAIGAIKNSEAYDANGNLTAPATQGKSSSAATYKLSAKFQPTKEFLVRGSLGSGFRAPTMLDIGQSSQLNGGVTASRPCPVGLRADLAQYCDSGNAEYSVLSGGNASTGSSALKPEHSKQWTAGFRYEPSPLFSGGVDIWNVVINDTINPLPEAAAFADAVTYASSFTLIVDPTTGVRQLALISQPTNSGKTHFQGIDLTAESRVATPIGALTTRGNATYMLKADHQLPGNPANQSSLGQYGTDNNVVFRWQAYLSASLETGAFTNSLAMSYKSAYQDESYTADDGIVFERAADGTIGDATSVTRRVSSYTTFDWQSRFAITKAATLTAGIRNLLDRDPPLSIQSASGGNMRGYDGRYTSPLGRTFYLAGNYKF